MTRLARLSAAADGAPVFVSPLTVSFVRRRGAEGGLAGTTITSASSDLIVRETLDQVVSALQAAQGATGEPVA